MIIIGEKINGSIPAVAEAIRRRDGDFIRQRALTQANAGADYIDCCASVGEDEVNTLRWLIGCIQSVTDRPISLDSPSPEALAEAFSFCDRPGIFNSVSGEGRKMDILFPILRENPGWQCIALLSDDTGIPRSAADRLRVFERILARARDCGIAPGRLYIDPLVEMLCTSENGIATNTEVISAIRKAYGDIHVVAAVSNVSYQLPARKTLNQAFTVLAMNAGLDAAILDPTDRDMMGAVYAAEALLGRDDYCMEYITAYREGRFGKERSQ